MSVDIEPGCWDPRETEQIDVNAFLKFVSLFGFEYIQKR